MVQTIVKNFNGVETKKVKTMSKNDSYFFYLNLLCTTCPVKLKTDKSRIMEKIKLKIQKNHGLHE